MAGGCRIASVMKAQVSPQSFPITDKHPLPPGPQIFSVVSATKLNKYKALPPPPLRAIAAVQRTGHIGRLSPCLPQSGTPASDYT